MRSNQYGITHENTAIKQEFYAAFGEAFTGFFALDTVQDEIQPV